MGPNEPMRPMLLANLTLSYVEETAAYLARPDRVMLPCDFGARPWIRAEGISVARMTVAVHYTPWGLPNWKPFRRRKAAGFATFVEPDSTYRWFPVQPVKR